MAFRAGDLGAARRLCDEVLEIVPADSEALNILGAIAFSERDFPEAERLFRLAAGASSANLAAVFNLGKVLEVQRRYEEAAHAYGKVLKIQPGNVETRLRLGIVRYELGAYDEAIAAFQDIVKNDPENGTAALSLGVALNTVGNYEESILVLRRLLTKEPDQLEAMHALADSLVELHRADEAIKVCEAILGRDPSDVQGTILLGQAECERNDFAAAERCFKRAITLAPSRHEAHMNLGVLMQRLGKIDEALQEGKLAAELAPTDPLPNLNYAFGLLLAGQLAKGLPALEWRLHDPRLRAHFPYRDKLPLWTGEKLNGKLLIAREQGLGDFILFSRFFPQIRTRVAELVVEVPEELLPLYADLPGTTVVADRCDAQSLSTFTAQVPLCSLAFALAVDETNVPANVPYVTASPQREAQFRERFAALGSGLRVGLVWAGSPGHLLDRYRSCPVEAFEALSDVSDVQWIGLQKGAHEPMRALKLLDLGGDLKDFGDTAAAIAALDIVISVDTAVAHLAGAMGKPVWLINGFGSYWLWQLVRGDSPWYPSMRLFRQDAPNDWRGLFAEVRAALEAIRRIRA